MTKQKLPEHIESVPPSREARAPYNFVPLPERVVPAEQQEPVDQSVYHADRHTGTIACTLTTASPMYVRCGYTPEDFVAYGEKRFDQIDNDEAKERRAQFFHLNNSEQPSIPGSSLRGMLRALVEIASYGKMDRMNDQQLFYRSVSDSNYQQIFVEKCGSVQQAPYPRADCFRTKVRTGFLRQLSGGYIIEECDFARIDHQSPNSRKIAPIPKIPGERLMRGRSGAEQTPNWCYQNKPIYVEVDQQEQDYFFPKAFQKNGKPRHPDLYLRFRAARQASFTPGQITNAQEGVLVLTGHMQNKHLEFVFLRNKLKTFSISSEKIKRFEDDDQITQWQEDAFAHNEPSDGARRDNGLLRDREPVFFLLNDDGSVRFFGRAQLFRLPYGFSPYDFTPNNIRYGQDGNRVQPITDIAETLFGFVPRDNSDKRKTVAGRVFIGDAPLTSSPKDALFDEPLTPQILGSPKPTTFQHYLVQTDPNADRRSLKHYASEPNVEEGTVIRGHKLYWHKDEIDPEAIYESDQQKIARAPKQYTQIRPVKPHTKFEFSIRFENLSQVELGALLWVLRLCDDTYYTEDKGGPYRFKLGMGKPLGMGAAQITSQVQTSNRHDRYKELFAEDDWAVAESEMTKEAREACINAFEQYVLKTSEEKVERLEDTSRIQCLLALLNWPGPDAEKTDYQKLDDFKARPVLPLPTKVLEASKDTPPSTTVFGKVLSSGPNSAGVVLDNKKSGRAQYGPNIHGPLTTGQRVRCEVNTDGKPTVIVSIE